MSGESRALVSEEEPTHNNPGRGARVSYRQRERGRAGRGGTTCTNLQLSSPVPLTGVCQPADAAGGGTAPMPTRGGGQPRGGLSRERSRVGADPPLGRPSRVEIHETGIVNREAQLLGETCKAAGSAHAPPVPSVKTLQPT